MPCISKLVGLQSENLPCRLAYLKDEEKEVIVLLTIGRHPFKSTCLGSGPCFQESFFTLY